MGLDAREMWQGYLADATEAFQEIEQSLLSLEEDPTRHEHINRLYRGLHTLKGNSGFLGLANVERLAHAAEDLVGLVRDKGVPLDVDMTELLLEVLDRLRTAVGHAAEAQADVAEEVVRDLVVRVVKHSSRALEAKNAGKAAPKAAHAPKAPTPPPPKVATPPPAPPQELLPPEEPHAEEPAPEPEPVHELYADVEADLMPWEDAAFLEIFLSVARDKMDELSAALANVAGQVPGSIELAEADAKLSEVANELRFAAERMNYERFLFALGMLEEAARAGVQAAAQLAGWERELYAELVKIEENYRALAAEPASFPFIALYCRSCADNVFASLAHLRALVDANATCFSRQDAEAIPGLFRELRACCDYYGFKGGSRSCLDQEDLYCRSISAKESLDEPLVARTREFIEKLGEAVEAVNRGEDCTDVAGVEPADDPMKYAEDVAQYGFSAELQLVVTRTNLGAISELVGQGQKVYEVRADLDEATGAAFFGWMTQRGVTCITSATVFAGDVTHFDFLLVAPIEKAEIERSLKTLDPSGKRLRLRIPAKGEPELVSAPVLSVRPSRRVSRAPGAASRPPSRAPEDPLIKTVDQAAAATFAAVSESFRPSAPPKPAKKGSGSQNGSAHNGSSHNGSAQNGSSQNGSSQNGSAQHATKEDGADKSGAIASEGPAPEEIDGDDAPAPKAARKTSDGGGGSASDFLRIDARKVSLIMDLAGEIGLATGAVTHHPEIRDLELEGFTAAAHKLEMLIRELQNEVSSMRLVPVAGVFQRMRRVVRDTARRTGKHVELVLRGEDTEIDKIMVDSLHDPLVHMLRNAIDHGLETPEERRAAGKPEAGTIVLEASHEAGEVSIGISDDGRGIDKDRVFAKAVERGLLGANAKPEESALLAMIFEPGFSTKHEVSELSGRGVGMDVVKTTVEGLRGRVHVKTQLGKGTRFVLRMPLTLAFIEAMAVEQRGCLYVLPIEKVFEVFKAGRAQIVKSSAEGHLLVRVRDALVPVCWIHRFYGDAVDAGAPPSLEDVVDKIVVVVQTAMGRLALPVDDLLGNQQVMLKPMRGVLSRIRASAGCGMLRSGDVAVALDCDALHA